MAIERQEAQGPKRLLCMFLIDENHHNEDKDPWPWGGEYICNFRFLTERTFFVKLIKTFLCLGEPIFRNGEFVGSLTTASYGFTLRKHIGIGYVKHPEGETVSSKFVKEGNYEIEIGGQRYPATVSVKIIIYYI